MIVVADTSALFAAFDSAQPEHTAATAVMEDETLLISPVVLTELDHLIHLDFGFNAAVEVAQALTAMGVSRGTTNSSGRTSVRLGAMSATNSARRPAQLHVLALDQLIRLLLPPPGPLGDRPARHCPERCLTTTPLPGATVRLDMVGPYRAVPGEPFARARRATLCLNASTIP